MTRGCPDPWYGGWYGRGFYRLVIVRGRHGRRYVTGWYDPFMWGGGFGGGWDNEVTSYTVYTSDLNLSIDRAGTGERLFEGRAQAQSRDNDLRSEEHTSELQSLMRISYAVFCLTKKTQLS